MHSTSTLSISEDGNADCRSTDSSFGSRGCTKMRTSLPKATQINAILWHSKRIILKKKHRKSQAVPWLLQLVSGPKPFRPFQVWDLCWREWHWDRISASEEYFFGLGRLNWNLLLYSYIINHLNVTCGLS